MTYEEGLKIELKKAAYDMAAREIKCTQTGYQFPQEWPQAFISLVAHYEEILAPCFKA
jgi:hypothetical protein